jgi:basic membrane protein A and related proteins
MMRQGLLKGAGLLLALAMVAAACGGDDDDDDAGGDGDGDEAAVSDFTACQVTDTGGVDDNSFNETAFNGLVSAGEELGFEPFAQESQAESDYAPNIQAMIDRPCTLVVTVGFLLGDATATAAEENPDQQFAIVDYDYSVEGGDSADEFENVRELTFSTDQAAFLAGYVAAATTETGTVGTYGGVNIPTVTIFMNGFAAGVDYFNEQEDGNVELVGWNAEQQDGLFTGDFEDQSRGRDTTEQLIDEGADIIMPVAGPVGQGSIEAIRAGGGNERLIWVDTDGCVSVPDDCDLFLTSVMKNMDVAVHDTVTAAAEGNFEGGAYVGTLENDGVGIAPFNEFEEEIPQELQDTLDELRQQIIDGEIDTNPAD